MQWRTWIDMLISDPSPPPAPPVALSVACLTRGRALTPASRCPVEHDSQPLCTLSPIFNARPSCLESLLPQNLPFRSVRCLCTS